MISEKDKKIIDDFLKEQNFNFDEYDEFIEYMQSMGMLNDDIGILNKRFFTKSNLKIMYERYKNPIKRVSKELGFTYKELAEQIGYTEGGLKTAIAKGNISEPMKKALELLVENYKLRSVIVEKDKKIENLTDILKTLKSC